ncbi:MAG: hypothetical protein HY667_04280 [Chloroflexi bacterium]|nr:hypothetical protein [Chloroflexota bacterium]
MDVYLDSICEETRIYETCYRKPEEGGKMKSYQDTGDVWLRHFDPYLFALVV